MGKIIKCMKSKRISLLKTTLDLKARMALRLNIDRGGIQESVKDIV